MNKQEAIGRTTDRIHAPAAFPNGYLNVESPDNLIALRADLMRALITTGCKERTYDKNATAYYKDDCPLRTEPVMLVRWVGILHGEAPAPESSYYGFDTIGLKVIIRGDGEIQDMMHNMFLAEYEPDPNGSEDYDVYSFGCKHVGIEMLDAPLTDQQLRTQRMFHAIACGKDLTN